MINSNSDYNVTQIQPSDCKQLEMYFERVMTVIGVRPLLLLLFDDDPLAEFDEHIQEVKSRGLRNQLADAFRQLDQLSDLRATMCATTGAIDELINFHLMEDQVLININLILFELFNFKLNPFLELKECAGAKSRLVEQRLKSLHRSSTCSSLLEEQQLNGELQQLKSEAELLHDAIFQLYEQFYRQSTDLIFGQLTRMYQEAETVTLLNAGCSVKVATGTGSTSLVGATSSQSGSIGDDGDTLNSIRSAHGSRLLRLEIFYLQEKLKCLNVAKLSKLIERYRLKEMLDEAIAAHDQFNQVAIERLQVKVKNCEIRLIDARMAILNEEESLLKKQITYLQTCDDRHLTIDLDMLACFTLDDNNWDVESFERQFDACSDQIVLHLDYFKVKLRSLARKRAVFRTKRKLYIEEKKHNLGPKVTVGTLDSSCSTSSGVDMATSDTSSSNKSEQLRRSRVKALQRLRAFRRKQHASINNLTDVLLPHKHHHANDGSSCDRTSNRSTCSRTTGNNDSNALTNLTVSAHDSNNELNSLLFDSDFSSFSSNCSQPQGSFMATKNDVVKCNPNWISGCNNRELRNESDSTFPSHSGVIDGVILDTLGKHST